MHKNLAAEILQTEQPLCVSETAARYIKVVRRGALKGNTVLSQEITMTSEDDKIETEGTI